MIVWHDGAVDYDTSELRRAGELRRDGLAKEAEAREIVLREVKAARKAKLTWREISEMTSYTDAQLQTLALKPSERAKRERDRRERRRKPAEEG